MTTTLNAPVSGLTPATGKLSFGGVFRSEWIKLMSLRSIRWVLGIMIVLSWGGSLLVASASTGWGEIPTAEQPSFLVQTAGVGTTFTVLIMGVLGVLAMTSEYSSGMILSTLTAVPRRTPMFVAKGLVVALLALIVGAVSILGGGLIGAMLLGNGAMVSLFEPEVLVSYLGSVLYLLLAALMSFGLGGLLRSSAGAISIMVVLVFVLTIVLQILTITGWDWVTTVSQWTPDMLGHEIATAALPDSAFTSTNEGMGYWGALGGLVGWAAVTTIPAALLLKTRDAV